MDQYQLFLFDFDGLLVDTEHLHFAAYTELCLTYGFELGWSFEQFCQAAHFQSQGMREALYAQFPALQSQEPRWEVLYQKKKEIYVRLLKQKPLAWMPGAEAMLERVHQAGVKHCVVTNSPREQVEIIKASLPLLQKIPVWLTREDYDRPKPAPDGYLKAIQLLAEKGDRIIGFEDSIKGLKALLGAGVAGVLICPAHHPQVKECATLSSTHFESLSDWILHTH